MQLEHFGEAFDRAGCNDTCDNCRDGMQSMEVDYTDVAKNVLNLIDQVKGETNDEGCTINQLADLYRGLTSSSKKLIFNFDAITLKGSGKKYKKDQVLNILHKMEAKHYLFERCIKGRMGFGVSKVQHGPDAKKLLWDKVNEAASGASLKWGDRSQLSKPSTRTTPPPGAIHCSGAASGGWKE